MVQHDQPGLKKGQSVTVLFGGNRHRTEKIYSPESFNQQPNALNEGLRIHTISSQEDDSSAEHQKEKDSHRKGGSSSHRK